MKRLKNNLLRCLCLLLALLTAGGAVPVPALAVDGQGEQEIRIGTAEEFLAFAENCALDSWSVGKTVVLTADISLHSAGAVQIPSFSGTFDGGSCTVSGLALSGAVSPAGLFGRIGEGGAVRNLNVSGTVRPGGSGGTAGGLAGENSGIIESCTFAGTVAGTENVGGLCGFNSESGKIQDCTVRGSVTGKSMTGGIAGQNLGVVSACVNYAYVNISSVDPGIDLAGMDIDINQASLTLRSLDTVNIISDTGGVAGQSGGMLLSCENRGIVGYPHIGYNTGGIAGRNSGYIANCSNFAAVYGRRDIGGVTGQTEPMIRLQVSPDELETLRQELERLESLVGDAAAYAGRSSSDISGILTEAGNAAAAAKDAGKTLSNQLSAYGDDALREINRGSDLIHDTFSQLRDLSGDGAAITALLSSAMEQAEDAAQILAGTDEPVNDALEALRDVTRQGEDAYGAWDEAVGILGEAVESLEEALPQADEAALEAGIQDIRDGIRSLQDTAESFGRIFDRIADAFDTANADLSGASQGLRELGSAFSLLAQSLGSLDSGFEHLRAYIRFNTSALEEARAELSAAGEDIAQAESAFQSALASLDRAAEDLQSVVTVDYDALSQSLRKLSAAAEGLRTALESTALEDLFQALFPSPSDLAAVVEAFSSFVSALQGGKDALTGLVKALEDILGSISFDPEKTGGSLQDLDGDTGDFGKAAALLASGAARVMAGLEALPAAIAAGNDEQRNAALEEIRQGLEEVSQASGLFSQAMDSFADALDPEQDGVSSLIEAIRGLREAMDGLPSVIDRLIQAFEELRGISFDGDAFRDALRRIEEGVPALREAYGLISAAADTLLQALSQFQPDLPAAEEALRSFVSALRSGKESLSALVTAIAEIPGSISIDAGKIDGTFQDLGQASDSFSQAASLLADGAARAIAGAEALAGAVSLGSDAQRDEALDEISRGLQELSQAASLVSQAMDTFAGALDKERGDIPGITSAIRDMGTAIAGLSPAIEQMAQGFEGLRGGISFDADSFRDALRRIEDGAEALRNSAGPISNAAEGLRQALDSAGEVSGLIRQSLESLGAAFDDLSGASDRGTVFFRNVKSLFGALANADPIQFQSRGSDVNASVERISGAVSRFGESLEDLNRRASSAASGLTGSLQDINDQFSTVTDTIMDLFYQVQNAGEEDLISDLSEEDVASVTTGKIFACENQGEVSGDINVGGIAGSMGVEVELDPENDLLSSTEPVYRREYELKAVLQDCRSSGAVSARRDYAGAICGRADLGLITGCTGLGTAGSESGDYVGGIVGFSSCAVRNCYAKCRLEGRRYVGGITGGQAAGTLLRSGAETSGCVSFVEIDRAEEYAGAVSGSDAGSFRENYFVSDSLAGLGRRSVAGQAESTDYKSLLSREDLPREFRSLRLRFLAGGETVKEMDFDFAASFDSAVFPAIPEKEGCFGRWDRTSLENLHFDTDIQAVYTPWISSLASGEKREDGRPVFFLEGAFDDTAGLGVQAVPYDGAPEGRTAWAVRRGVERWKLSLPDSGEGQSRLRYLSPDGRAAGLELWILEPDGWKELEPDSFGSYMVFSTAMQEPEVAVVFAVSLWWAWALAAGAVLLSALFLVLWLARRRKKRRLEAQRKAEAEKTAKAVSETGQDGSEKQEALPPQSGDSPLKPRKRARRLIALALVLVLALGAAAAVFAFGLNRDLEVLRLLRRYAGKDSLAMELTVDASLGEESYHLSTELFRLTVDGNRISCAVQPWLTLWYSGGKAVMADGSAWDAGGIFPDRTQLLENAVALFRDSKVSVIESPGERLYTLAVSGADALDLLQKILPWQDDLVLGVSALTLELAERNGNLYELRVATQGTMSTRDSGGEQAMALNAALRINESLQAPELTTPAREALLSDAVKTHELPEELTVLFGAWMRLEAAAPRKAELSVSADCGPLLVNDEIEWTRFFPEGQETDIVRKNGRTLYLYKGEAWTEAGSSASDRQTELAGPSVLTETAARLCIQLRPASARTAAGSVYTMDLPEGSLALLKETLLPAEGSAAVDLKQGTLEVYLAEGRLERLHFRLRGTSTVLDRENAASVRAEIRFVESDVPELPDWAEK